MGEERIENRRGENEEKGEERIENREWEKREGRGENRE
jgi:hypothetical protein